jgi:hypothetical protein
MFAPARPQKITFAEMRSSGVRGLLVYCSDYRCSHHIAIGGDRWSDDVRLFDLEPRFVCSACGKRGADVRPNFVWDKAGRVASITGSRRNYRWSQYGGQYGPTGQPRPTYLYRTHPVGQNRPTGPPCGLQIF